MKELRFDDQVVIITGAGGAIGAGYARYLADRGASIVVNDIGIGESAGKRSAADAVVEEIQASGGKAVADRHDVVNDADGIIRTALDAFGRVDVVINNAGVWDDARIYDEPYERFTRTINIHLMGTLNVTRAAWHELAKTSGRVVQTASAAICGGSRTSAYAIAKAGIFGSVHGLKLTADGSGIKINGVLPLAFSQMTDKAVPEGPHKDILRKQLPSQVASFVALLCHSSVPFSGMCFSVGGGHVDRVVFAHNEGARGNTAEEFFELSARLTDTSELQDCGNALEYSAWKTERMSNT